MFAALRYVTFRPVSCLPTHRQPARSLCWFPFRSSLPEFSHRQPAQRPARWRWRQQLRAWLLRRWLWPERLHWRQSLCCLYPYPSRRSWSLCLWFCRYAGVIGNVNAIENGIASGTSAIGGAGAIAMARYDFDSRVVHGTANGDARRHHCCVLRLIPCLCWVFCRRAPFHRVFCVRYARTRPAAAARAESGRCACHERRRRHRGGPRIECKRTRAVLRCNNSLECTRL